MLFADNLVLVDEAREAITPKKRSAECKEFKLVAYEDSA